MNQAPDITGLNHFLKEAMKSARKEAIKNA